MQYLKMISKHINCSRLFKVVALFLSLSSGLLLYSCKNRGLDASSSIELRGINSLGIANVVITDTITISTERTSMSGRWTTDGKSLIFADKGKVPVSFYSPGGEFEKQIFVQGRGPDEVLSPATAMLPLSGGGYAYFSAGDARFYLFDSLLNNLSSFNLLRVIAKDVDWDDLLRNPDPENIAMYEQILFNNDITELGDYILFPTTTEHQRYNGFMKNQRAKEFYRDSYTLMAINKRDPAEIRIFGHFPAIYNRMMIPNFMNRTVASDGSNLFVSYEADSLIYAYDKDLQLSFAFGIGGKDVKDDYPEVTTFEKYEETNRAHHTKYGHYLQMVYGDGYLIRKYNRPNDVSAIQIYKDYNLLCDVEMPYRRFEIIGYIEPFFYAQADIDFEYELCKIIRFKIASPVSSQR